MIMKLYVKDLLVGFEGKLKVGSEVLNREISDDDVAKAFGLALKAIRNSQEITLRKMAEDVDIPNPTINRYENGQNLPSLSQAIKIANYFDLSVELMLIMGLTALYDGADIVPFYSVLKNALENSKKENALNRARRK